MERENKHAAAINRDRRKRFGQRLELYRVRAKLKQKDMAVALDISERQWRRYVSGERISPEMIRKIAKVLDKPMGRLLLLAGHESDEPSFDAEAHLRLISDYVLEGEMNEALFCFYEFYYIVNRGDKENKPMDAPLLANDFTAAAVVIDRMPNWLRWELIMYLMARERGVRRGKFPPPTALWEEARTLIRKGLPKAMLLGGRLSVGEYGRSSESKGGVPGKDGQPGVGGRSHEQPDGGDSDQAGRLGGFIPAGFGYPLPFSGAPKRKLTAGAPVEAPPDDLESLAADAELPASILARNEPERLAAIESKLASLLRRRRNKPAFAAIGRGLEALKRRHRRGQLAGLELLARLLEIARELAEAEKGVSPREAQEEDKAALAKLFKEGRGARPTAQVRRIVDEIDRNVRLIHFSGWQRSFDREHAVIKALRGTLRKYNLNHEHELFDRVYEYVKEYY